MVVGWLCGWSCGDLTFLALLRFLSLLFVLPAACYMMNTRNVFGTGGDEAFKMGWYFVRWFTITTPHESSSSSLSSGFDPPSSLATCLLFAIVAYYFVATCYLRLVTIATCFQV